MYNDINYNDPLKVSVNTYVWYFDFFGGNGQADEAIGFIRECGFEAIDYNFEYFLSPFAIRKKELDSVYDLPLDELTELFAPLKAALTKHGVAIGQGHGPYPLMLPDSEEFDGRIIASVEKILALCKYLECPALVLHAERPYSMEKNMEFFRRLIPAGLETGVKICLENLFIRREKYNDPFCDPKSTCRYIDMLNREAGADIFGFCYDVGHANITGLDLYEDICTMGDRLVALHIHDNDRLNDQHLIPFTQKVPLERVNCTDWEGLIKGLREIGYKGTLNFETHGCFDKTPFALIPDTLRFISGVGRYFRDQIQKG